MKEKKTIIYQLLVIVLLIVLAFTIWGKSTQSSEASASVKGEDIGNGWEKIDPADIPENPLYLMNTYKGILAMGDKKEHNAMTIGFGTFGRLWQKPVFTVYVSSSRYSYSLMEKDSTFSVSFFNKSHWGDVMYLGTHSGRDGDKIGKTQLHLTYTQRGVPTFNEAFMVIECRKIYGAPFDSLRLGDTPRKLYGGLDIGIHSEYVGEITNVYVKDANR